MVIVFQVVNEKVYFAIFLVEDLKIPFFSINWNFKRFNFTKILQKDFLKGLLGPQYKFLGEVSVIFL